MGLLPRNGQNDVGPAGRKADGQRRVRRRRNVSRQRPVRFQRGALGRRQHRPDRRFSVQRRQRRGVGVHADGLDVDPAGSETHRHRRGRRRRIRCERCARRGNTALIGVATATTGASVRLGCSRARARPGRSRAKSSSRKPAKRSAPANSGGRGAFLGRHDHLRADRQPWRTPRHDARYGSAWVFTRSGTTWTQQGEKLTGRGDGETEEARRRRIRRQRGAVLRRQHRADRRPGRQRKRRRHVGVHALGHDLVPARRKAHGQR